MPRVSPVLQHFLLMAFCERGSVWRHNAYCCFWRGMVVGMKGRAYPPAFTAARGAYENILSAQQSFLHLIRAGDAFIARRAGARGTAYARRSRAYRERTRRGPISRARGKRIHIAGRGDTRARCSWIGGKICSRNGPIVSGVRLFFFRIKTAYNGVPAGELIEMRS